MKKQLLAMLLLLMLCLPCIALAADENTTLRFPEHFTDGNYLPSGGIATFALERSETIADAWRTGLSPWPLPAA